MMYIKHIFFCCNVKVNANGCGSFNAEEAFMFTRDFLKSQKSWGIGKIRASKSGCLGMCDNAPVCVIYPQATWYRYDNLTDVEEIIKSDLLNNQVVSRLILLK